MNNMKYSKSVFINLIITSIIAFLIWGPFFPDLIVSFSALFFLYYVIKKKDYKYFINTPLIIFFIFCLYCILVSIFVAENVFLSFESSLFYFRIGIFSCFIWYLINKDKSILTYFYYALVLCFSALIMDGYFQYFSGQNILGYKLINNQVSSLFGDEAIMGSYLSRLFPLLFALFVIKKKMKYENYFIGLVFILVEILIFLSGERVAFYFLNLSTIFIIILIKDYQKFRLVTFIVSLICILFLSFYSSKLSNRMFFEPAKNLGIIESLDKPTIFSPAHDSLIRTAYNMFKSQPIFGHGPKMFRVKCHNKDFAVGISPCMTHPHNFYVQLLAETGIVGFLFLLSILIHFMYISLIQFKSIIFKQERYLSDYQVCLLAGMMITVWPLSTNGNFFNNWLMIVYSLPVGFYLQSIYSKKIIKKDL